ncbi:MAG: hypothetical protein PHN44_00135 [Candidatus Marinimicrobia bacterium]|nr:hypothetical protein [Candidatus Neomarinimicrobiota bacterium]
MDNVSREVLEKKRGDLIITTGQMRQQLVQLQANIHASEGAIQMCDMLLSEPENEIAHPIKETTSE